MSINSIVGAVFFVKPATIESAKQLNTSFMFHVGVFELSRIENPFEVLSKLEILSTIAELDAMEELGFVTEVVECHFPF